MFILKVTNGIKWIITSKALIYDTQWIIFYETEFFY